MIKNTKAPNDQGQDISTWDDSWEGLSPESEIQMWDFYGMRPWLLKFAPRYGKVLEAGCGLGRFVLYLSKLGIDIEGVDFSEPTIQFLNQWRKAHDFPCNFAAGDVTDLQYPDNSLSGYISLGVIEHFIEGPHRPLNEAYRVLRPGGIAIISTPSVSFNILSFKLKKAIKNIIKKIIRYPNPREKFFQYWYRPGKLKKFIENSGLKVTQYGGGDLLYAFCESSGFSEEKIKENTFAYWFSHKFENSFLNKLGAQSITISVKMAKEMHCFLCGDRTAKESSLSLYVVPLCESCSTLNTLSDFYKKGKKTACNEPYQIGPALIPPTEKTCDHCHNNYVTDKIFENFGFSCNVCPDCLKKPEINILISNKFVKPIWRKRKS
jgi:ubiquinone/menaquinone biosynthesis C-methylase UbiE